MKKITKIEPKIPIIHEKKKVAAYARVSREYERLLNSLSAQVSYYNNLIQKNPEWEFAGVYVDEGITGTSLEKRTGFQQLLSECQQGKVDMILVKSISRFGRNTVDVLKTVRDLKNIGVGVYFEEQNINSMDADGELMLTILASFAEEESRNISANIRWANTKKAEKGLMLNASAPYGYRYDPDNKTLVIVPEQAEIIRKIYDLFVKENMSVYKIANLLNADGIISPRGSKWAHTNLRRILKNPTYIGDLIIGGYYSDGPLTQKLKKNYGERKMYYAEETHEPIVDREVFIKAQEIYEYYTHNPRKIGKGEQVFNKNIICRGCGKEFSCNTTKFKNKERQLTWACRKNPKCQIVSIKEVDLKNIIIELLGIQVFSSDIYTEFVDHIEVDLDDYLYIYMKDGSIKNYYYKRRRQFRKRWEYNGKKSNDNSSNN